MTWTFYPAAWNGFADIALNTAVGCSNMACNTRAVCWARGLTKRGFGDCAECKNSEFRVHEHFERWEKFKAKPGQRIALNFRGDMFDPERMLQDSWEHVRMASLLPEFTFLIQTRHVGRMLEWLGEDDEMPKNIEWGTSYCGPADMANIEALAELPPCVGRFVAFEPCDALIGYGANEWSGFEISEACKIAKPNWCYIGPSRKGALCKEKLLSARQAALDCGVKVIMKRKCGQELWAMNEGVALP